MFDGITGNEKGPNAALGEITTNVVNADGGHLLDSDGDGVVDSSTGLLVGDLNLDGIMNNGETGFFVSLADATTVLKSTNHELGGGAM